MWLLCNAAAFHVKREGLKPLLTQIAQTECLIFKNDNMKRMKITNENGTAIVTEKEITMPNGEKLVSSKNVYKFVNEMLKDDKNVIVKEF